MVVSQTPKAIHLLIGTPKKIPAILGSPKPYTVIYIPTYRYGTPITLLKVPLSTLNFLSPKPYRVLIKVSLYTLNLKP